MTSPNPGYNPGMLSVALAILSAAPVLAAVVDAPAAPAPLPFSVVAAMSARPAASLPSFLSVADPSGRALLAEIVGAAQASPTARRVLNKAALAAQARGRPLVVELSAMQDLGAYSYDTGVLSLNLHGQSSNPRSHVSTLIHELVHFMQRDLPLPSDLLETELEAYVVDFRVSRELDIKAPRGSFNAYAQGALKKGLSPFMAVLGRQYRQNAPLWRTRTRDYESRLNSVLEKSSSKLAKLEDKRAKKNLMLEQMRGLGQTESEIDAYREDSLPPIDAAAMKLRRVMDWARKDLAVLADPATLRQARAYSRAVIRRARAFQRLFARD